MAKAGRPPGADPVHGFELAVGSDRLKVGVGDRVISEHLPINDGRYDGAFFGTPVSISVGLDCVGFHASYKRKEFRNVARFGPDTREELRVQQRAIRRR